jgi:hypothetical protein
MNKDNIKKYRLYSVVVFAIAVVGFTVSMSMKGNAFFLISGLIAFSSMSYFLFTEAFFFPVPERSKLNIYVARFFFVLTIPVILELLIALVKNVM